MHDNIPDPILITGAARSGTSLVAGSINLCGAFGGVMAGPNRNNKRGMYENAFIREHIVKPYLRQMGVDALGQFPLPEISKVQIPCNWRDNIFKVFKDQGYKEGALMYKGAKMCLFWPVWNYAFPKSRWIIVRRRTGDIVNSCMHTGFMRAFRNTTNQRKVGAKNEREGWLWWVHEHEKKFIEMIQAGLNVKIVWPERMVDNDFSQMMEVIDWLGLKWNNEVLNFVSPKLWKSRKKKYDL